MVGARGIPFLGASGTLARPHEFQDALFSSLLPLPYYASLRLVAIYTWDRWRDGKRADGDGRKRLYWAVVVVIQGCGGGGVLSGGGRVWVKRGKVWRRAVEVNPQSPNNGQEWRT